ncbi:MAG TPA: tetratricopeptide repeat protein [Bryobacteraceae bacterium]|nr:tetratricopeptide repeat protein [Bryobacteraceae bacterium]
MQSSTSQWGRSSRWPAVAVVLVVICLVFSGCSRESREARYLASGKQMLAKKDYARAIIQFSNAAKMMPKDAEPRYQLALAYLAQRDFRTASGYLSTAVALNPKHDQARLKLAELYAASKEKKKVEEAQQSIRDLINAGQTSAEALDALAITEWRLGSPQDAEKHLEEAVAKFPSDLASAVSLARMKQGHKDLAGAEAVLKKVAAQQPHSADALLALGQFYLNTGRPVDAESQFRRATEVDPKSGAALLTLAVLQARTGKLDQAEQSYARLSAFPEAQFRTYHASFLAARAKHNEAIAEAEKLSRQYPDDRAVRTLLTEEYLRTQRNADAVKLLTAALARNSKDFEALLQRSAIYLTLGRVDDAEKDLTSALHFHSDSPEAHFLMAKLHQARGASANQRQELGEALRLRPEYLQPRIQLAQVLISSGAAQAALDLMNAREVQPYRNNLAFLVARNWALLAVHQYAEARKEVDRGLAAVRAPNLLLQDAYLKLDEKNYSAARASLAEALNRSPEDLRVLRLIVGSYAAQKQPAEGARMVQEYARQHPKSAPVQQFLAELLMADGHRAEARTALMAAKAADPKFTRADLALAQLDIAEGHVNEAAQRLSTLLAQNPKNPPAQLMLAGIEDSRGNRTAAIGGYKKILETQPDNLLVLNNLAYDLAENKEQQDEALRYAQKAAELAPDAPAVQNTLGWVLYHKGLYSMALPHLEKAADKDPTARHKCHLAMVYLKMGDQKNGEENLAAAMKLDPNIPEIRAAQQIMDNMHADR